MQMMSVNVTQEEKRISDDIFSRLTNIPLIDKYQAYQLLDDKWIGIQTDLEIIQTEGFEATKKVDPNMVVKKVKGKDEEVQDGWIGRVIPFELVQSVILIDETQELKQTETDLEKVLSEKDELLEKLIELGEGGSLLNDDDTTFVAKEVTKEAKALTKNKEKYTEDSLEYIVVRVDTLMTREKKLKKEVKEQTEALHTLTKTTIENLEDDEALLLLEQKWINPLYYSLLKLPNSIINDLVAKTKVLAEKYAVTYMDLDREIKDAEQSLSLLIDDLEGNEFDMKGLKEFQTLLGVKDEE